jgi:hypothetical protein
MGIESERVKPRTVGARVYTPSGWIHATFHLPPDQTFLSFLNRVEDFFTLTSVYLPWQQKPLEFLALQRNAALLVLPELSEAGAIEDEAVPHQVSCLLQGGVVMGTLHLPPDERVSDRLMRGAHFHSLRNCTVGLDATAGARVEGAPAALVNATRVVGIAEM